MLDRCEIKKLVKMLKMTQEELKQYAYQCLLTYYNKESIDLKDGFIFCKGNIPVMLVAHLDTVAKKPTQNIVYNNKFVIGINTVLGGDDRNGIFSILKILKNGFRPYVLFTEDEEVGGVGVKKFVKTHPDKPNLKYIVELDRKGHTDCVFYDCGNKSFEQYVESFGFKTAYGSFSDICTISPQYDVASVNLSIGYYNEHTCNEYINLRHMNDTILKVCNMLSEIDNCLYYDYQQIIWQPQYNINYVTNSSQKQDCKIWSNGSYIDYQEYYSQVYPSFFEEWEEEQDFNSKQHEFEVDNELPL